MRNLACRGQQRPLVSATVAEAVSKERAVSLPPGVQTSPLSFSPGGCSLRLMGQCTPAHLFPTPHPVTPHWWLEISRGGTSTPTITNQSLFSRQLVIKHLPAHLCTPPSPCPQHSPGLKTRQGRRSRGKRKGRGRKGRPHPTPLPKPSEHGDGLRWTRGTTANHI